ncbi:GNAT family N-acetyltransferase [Catellatospora bangladeshensis]|uniref:GNAT family N-acetyltransferase n=1 Tax=Catellatospora bangladeshensis TaxID=310355 RepID=A0A8J3JUM7_9ACTN|nr:GNAT family N-acetyltransferase [Catellatospora bangladeshensis]GIF85455.1 GNAT family N-acetyltransferase [Catellatospora bangladeshensis]
MDDTGVTIRIAGAEAIDALEPLWLSLHEHHRRIAPDLVMYADERSWPLRRDLYRRWITEPGSFVLLAEDGPELVGYAFTHVFDGPDDTWVSGDRIAELETLSVAASHRGRGVGTRLLDAVDARLSELGVTDLYISTLADNHAAARVYERRGLRPLMVKYARLAASPRFRSGHDRA